MPGGRATGWPSTTQDLFIYSIFGRDRVSEQTAIPSVIRGRSSPMSICHPLYFSADVPDSFPSLRVHARALPLRVRVPLGANRPVRGQVVRRVCDRFRMLDV